MINPFEITELVQSIKACFPEITGKPTLPKSVDKSEVKILIAEDNIANQKIMGAMLKFLGYSYETANDGYEAYNKALEQKFDLIIIDIRMPKMDGFEVSKRIIEHDKDALIIAISADSDPETREKSELAGIKEFISKPIRVEELKRLLIKYFFKVT
jgi:CheY-like chemotaxis protein